VKPSTVNYECAILRRGFNLAIKAVKVASRPGFDMLEVHNTRTGFFEPGQYSTVLQHLPDYLRLVAETAYITGWRTKSELLTRQWRHIDLENGWMRLEPGEGKTKEPRAFPLTAELVAILARQRERVRAIERSTGTIIPWVLVHNNGRRIKNFRYAWAKACREADVPGRLVHDFRRTAVRNLERAGVSRSAAMAMTGHKTEAVYHRYAIVDSHMLQEAAAVLAYFMLPTQKSKYSQSRVDWGQELMPSPFKKALFFNTFFPTREWRNGRRAGLRIQCRKAWGFKSPLSHSLQTRTQTRAFKRSMSLFVPLVRISLANGSSRPEIPMAKPAARSPDRVCGMDINRPSAAFKIHRAAR